MTDVVAEYAAAQAEYGAAQAGYQLLTAQIEAQQERVSRASERCRVTRDALLRAAADGRVADRTDVRTQGQREADAKAKAAKAAMPDVIGTAMASFAENVAKLTGKPFTWPVK